MLTQQRIPQASLTLSSVTVLFFMINLNHHFITSFQPQSISKSPSKMYHVSSYDKHVCVNVHIHVHQYSKTSLYGIDFDSLDEYEECDFKDGDLRNVDFGKCLPFPSVHITPEDVVTLCMESLLINDEPKKNAGLEVCYNFSSDRCRAANGGTLEAFFGFAGNPTFRTMVNAREWKVLSVGPIINAGQSVTSTGLGVTRGAMKTVLISVQPRDPNLKERKFLWTMQQERRPPKQGCWLVHECIAIDTNSFQMTL